MKIRKTIAAVTAAGAIAAASTAGLAPAAHAAQNVDATLGSSVTLDATGATNVSGWTLATSGANTASGGTLGVTSNSPYTLSVTFDKTRMTEWDTTLGTPAYVASGKALTSPLTVTPTRTGGTAPVPTVTAGAVSGTSTLLATGVGTGTDSYSVSLGQPTTVADNALATGHTYHIVLTYTASSTLG